MFSEQSQMSFLFENIHFENEFRDWQAQRDGQAHPLQSINRLRRFFLVIFKSK